MSKSQEQRVADAAEALRAAGQRMMFNASFEEVARIALEAADRESPKWPADESVRCYRKDLKMHAIGPGDSSFEVSRRAIRSALLADPIIKAAVSHRDKFRGNPSEKGCAVCVAVNEAGL